MMYDDELVCFFIASKTMKLTTHPLSVNHRDRVVMIGTEFGKMYKGKAVKD